MPVSSRRSLLVLGAGVLVLLVGCGSGDANLCEETSCVQGTCAVREARAVCLCGDQPCGTAASGEAGRMAREAVALSSMATYATSTTTGSPAAAYFSFVAEAKHKYFFGCEPRSLSSCRVQLFSDDGLLLGELEYATGFFIQFRADRAQTYYLAISTSKGASGTFNYQFKHLGFDDHGDFVEGATRVDLGGLQAPISGKLEAGGDRDMFRVEVNQGNEYRFTCRSPDGASLEPALWDDHSEPQAAASSVYGADEIRVTYRAASTQSLFVSIGQGIRGTSTGTYACDVAVDEDGDTLETARALVPGTEARGQLTVDDVDLFTLALEAGHFYRVSCEAMQGRCALALDAQAPAQPGAPLAFKARVAGIASVRLTGDPGSSYTLRAEDLGADDHGDGAPQATALTAPATLAGSLTLASDLDVFSFPALKNHLYRVTCDATAGELGWKVEVQNPRGYPRTWTHAGVGEATEALYEAEESTTYTVVVSSPTSGRTGPYACRLEPAGVDDYGDNDSDATLVSFPSVLEVNVETMIDADEVLFHAPADHLLRIRCSSSRGQVCRLEVRSQGSYPGTWVTTESGEVQVSNPASTWIVWVAAPAGETGRYTLSLEDLGPGPAQPLHAPR